MPAPGRRIPDWTSMFRMVRMAMLVIPSAIEPPAQKNTH